jgi:hypothetical protein
MAEDIMLFNTRKNCFCPQREYNIMEGLNVSDNSIQLFEVSPNRRHGNQGKTAIRNALL